MLKIKILKKREIKNHLLIHGYDNTVLKQYFFLKKKRR